MPAYPFPQPAPDRSHPVHATHICRACGTPDQDTPATSFVYRGETSFCLPCWQTLPGAALRRVVAQSGAVRPLYRHTGTQAAAR